jgi:hypothetical protein
MANPAHTATHSRGRFAATIGAWWLALNAMAAFLPPASAAPTASEQQGRTVLANAHLRVVLDPAHGGAISAVTTLDGRSVCTGHSVYTDRGLYGDGVYVGTSAVATKLIVREAQGRITARAEGVLAKADGTPSGAPGSIAYWLEYTLGDEGQVRVEWGATPGFTSPACRFLSYIFSLNGCTGVFANTEDGVLLQGTADHSTRTVQSAERPLNAGDPWVGLMYRDGTVMAITKLDARPPFANVFLHEGGNGSAGLFLAWISGEGPTSLQEGQELRGGFTLGLYSSFEEFRASRR